MILKKIIILSIVSFTHCVFAGDLITETITNGCGVIGTSPVAVMEPNQYTCDTGYYLPANVDGCVACPADATCDGGTFIFNENTFQGIIRKPVITSNIPYGCGDISNAPVAIMEPNQYTCDAGYYLSANVAGCVQCPANSYCLGGTYIFSENINQGAVACPNGFHSPAGSSSASQCIEGYTCTSGQYLPANTTTCVACPTGYTCSGGTYNLDADNDQGLVANSIAITWQDNDGTTITSNSCTYGQLITLPADPTRKGYSFTGWRVVN